MREQACRAVTAYGFEQLKLHRICAETVDPVRSGALAEKLGMRQEEVLRQHSLQHDGSWKNLYWYGLLRGEWAGA